MLKKRLPLIVLAVDAVYAVYHGVLGYQTASPWFCATCVYYLLLSIMQFGAVLSMGKRSMERGMMTMTGVLLMILSLVLAGIMYITLDTGRVTVHGTIPMITIAAYTFGNLSVTVVDGIRNRKGLPLSLQTRRGIRYAKLAVSVLTMQQSMLVSFGDGSDPAALALNIMTGSWVFAIVMGIGIYYVRKSLKKGKNSEED